MTSENYASLPQLVVDILNHIDEHGNFIEIDNLPKELRFRWKCTKTGKTWIIQLSKVRKMSMGAADPITPIIREAIMNNRKAEDWQNLLIRDNEITRQIRSANKLKAFW